MKKQTPHLFVRLLGKSEYTVTRSMYVFRISLFLVGFCNRTFLRLCSIFDSLQMSVRDLHRTYGVSYMAKYSTFNSQTLNQVKECDRFLHAQMHFHILKYILARTRVK